MIEQYEVLGTGDNVRLAISYLEKARIGFMQTETIHRALATSASSQDVVDAHMAFAKSAKENAHEVRTVVETLCDMIDELPPFMSEEDEDE